ncbi:MAG: DUF3987 domain-containing protein [Bacillati bacterium]
MRELILVQQNLILETIDYLNRRFPKREEYAKGVALSLASAISINSVMTDSNCPIDTKSNLYVLLCGDSNTGKTSIIKYGMGILNDIKYRALLGDDATAESLPKHLQAYRTSLLFISEFTNVINAYRKKAYMAGMREMLIKTYDGTVLTQLRATKEQVEAKNYTVNVLTSTQPVTIMEESSEADVQSGFFPRFLWFHITDAEYIRPRNMDDATVKQRSALVRMYENLYDIMTHNRIHFIFSDKHLSDMHRVIFPIQQSCEDHHFQPFYDRIYMFCIKIAMLHRIMEPSFIKDLPSKSIDDSDNEFMGSRNAYTDLAGDNRKNDITLDITDDSVKWAMDFIVDYATKNLPHTVSVLRLSDPDKVYDIIKRYQDTQNVKSMPENELYRKLAISMKSKVRIDNAIELALKMDLITFSKTQTARQYSIVDLSKRIPIEKYTGNSQDATKTEPPKDNTDDWGG